MKHLGGLTTPMNRTNRFANPEMAALSSSIISLLDRRPMSVERSLVNRKDQGTKLVDFSIFHKVPQEMKDSLVHQVMKQPVGDRAVGSLVGLAVGDWVGVPLEFLDVVISDERTSFWDPASFSYVNPNTKETERGRMHLGQWSDDTSMALCMADSLLLLKGTFDGTDIRQRFWAWQAEGYNNCFRKDTTRPVRTSFGLGYNIASSLLSLAPGVPPSPAFESTLQDSGNGSLMRLAPIPICSFRGGVEEVLEAAARSSLTTHPGLLASESCQFLAFVIMRAISRPLTPDMTPKEFLDEVSEDYRKIFEARTTDVFGAPTDSATRSAMLQLITSSPTAPTEACWAWKEHLPPLLATTIHARGAKYNGYPVTRGYFGSFCMDGLSMALNAFYTSKSFEETLTRAVNFLGDADSVGAIAGQMAGAFYGVSGIDRKYLEEMRKWDDNEIACRAALLFLLKDE